MNGKRAGLGFMLLGMVGALQVTMAAGRPLQNANGAEQPWQMSVSAEELTAQEETDMLFMREEEKLARDVYTFLYDLWSSPVFDNIAESEQRHMDSMAVLVDTYDLVDPVQDGRTGVFTDPELASLFISLTGRGQASLLEALEVGGFIEETDMRDIQAAIDSAGHADIIQTYENLLRGSRNHLRAYVRTIESMGAVYEAQVLTQSEVDAIVDSPTERGR